MKSQDSQESLVYISKFKTSKNGTKHASFVLKCFDDPIVYPRGSKHPTYSNDDANIRRAFEHNLTSTLGSLSFVNTKNNRKMTKYAELYLVGSQYEIPFTDVKNSVTNKFIYDCPQLQHLLQKTTMWSSILKFDWNEISRNDADAFLKFIEKLGPISPKELYNFYKKSTEFIQ